MTDQRVSVLVSGIGGYGYYYLKTLLKEFPVGKIKLAGVVDPFPKLSGLYQKVVDLNVPVYDTIDAFYNDDNQADLVVISSPIQYHIPQSISALQNGSNVLCDKPLGASIPDARELIKTRDSSGKWLMVGYQWSYSRAIRELKSDIINGRFGKPIRMKSLCLWPRDDEYYSRNYWAGKIRDKDGLSVYDSPANNAMAHFLHNMLFLGGDDMSSSAKPDKITAECYKANPVETFDTIACRVVSSNDIEMLFYATHAGRMDYGPVFELEFDDARISYGIDNRDIIARLTSGESINYGNPDSEHQFRKLFEAVEYVHNPGEIICGPEAAMSHMICIKGMHESVQVPIDFPISIVKLDKKLKRTFVDMLDEILLDAYDRNVLPNETGAGWASEGRQIDLKKQL